MRSAQYQIKREHASRINKVRDVAKSMSKTTLDQQQNKQHGRDSLER
jgi:hypothetical protein